MTEAGSASLDLDGLAQAVVDRGLAVPAMFFLELHRPLAHLASQAMVVGTPILAPLLGLSRFDELREVLADPIRYKAFLELLENKAGGGREA